MPGISLYFNLNKKLKRADVVKLGEEIAKVAREKKNPVSSMTLQVEGVLDSGDNVNVTFPFSVVEK